MGKTSNDTEVSRLYSHRQEHMPALYTSPLLRTLLTLRNSQQEKTSLLSLPDELLNIIAWQLQASRKKRSLANLGMCSRRLRGVIAEVLWKEVDWRSDTWSILGQGTAQERLLDGSLRSESSSVMTCLEGTLILVQIHRRRQQSHRLLGWIEG